MKVLVLGGNGFIGSHIVDQLLLRKHEVCIFGRGADKFQANKNVKCYAGDFSDTLLLSEALTHVDVVVHSISTTVPSTSNHDPVADIQQNLINTVKLLQSMRQSKVNRLIYLSSGGTVYGKPTQLPVPESHPLNPICSYGVVKVAIEHYIGMFKELYGLKAIILRPSNPYGPRQGHGGVQGALSTFLFNNMQHKKINIWGDGEIKRGYIYIQDLAELCCLAVESQAEGIFNVDSGESHSLNTLIKLIEQTTGIKSNIEFQGARAFDVQDIRLDIAHAKSTFNWKPQYTISEGIAAFHKAII